MTHIKVHLISKQTPVTVACSGGVDSVAIAHLLATNHYNVSLFHFNHKCQEINDQMQKGVEELAKALNLPLVTIINTELGLKSEADFRRVRLQAYRTLGTHIITGHHLGDCVSGYLMNTLKGQPEYAPVPLVTELTPTTAIIRPFLTTSKEKLSAYADRHNLGQYITTDPTNTDTKYRRNWINQDLIPIIPPHMGLSSVVKKRVEALYRVQPPLN